MPSDLFSGLIRALIGAAVGGFFTYLAARTQTTRTIEAATQQAREAAQAERQRSDEAAEAERVLARRHRAHDHAVTMLEAIASLERAIPEDLRRPWSLRTVPTPEHRAMVERGQAALARLRRAELVDAPVLADPAVTERWAALTRLAQVYSDMPPDHFRADHPTFSAEALERAERDLRNYSTYVHATLEAWLLERPLPPDALPPVLTRNDGAAWLGPHGA